jgi:integrase/recombinase XerD
MTNEAINQSISIKSNTSTILRQSLDEIAYFIDSLWLENGLSKNTLSAYRSDLEIFANWLFTTYQKSILEATQV